MSFLKRRRNGGRDGAPNPEPTDGSAAGGPVVDRYAKLNERDAVTELGTLNQAELTEVEAYESEHRDRPAVLNKLRYLRQPEPLPDYDAMDADAIAKAVADADLPTLKAIREYERKMQDRSSVLAEVSAALHRSEQRIGRADGPALDASQPGVAPPPPVVGPPPPGQ